ncbi:MAG: hypothetical protein KC466_04255 [Myxococcales bacterium]|nr:hypothetical protein [Myxococcales bacterium]
MDLRHDFEHTGGVLFRWRSALPFGLAGFVLIALRDYRHLGENGRFDGLWEAFCLAVGFFGLGIRAVTVGHCPKHTSGRNSKHQRAARLNTTGMYSIVRHPLYLGNFFMGLGVTLFFHDLFVTMVYVLAFGLYYERIMFAEEAFLRERYGDKFLAWATTTPAFIPRPRNWTPPDLPFSVRSVLRREYSGFFNLIVFLFIFEFLGDWFADGRVGVDPIWAVLVALAVTV